MPITKPPSLLSQALEYARRDWSIIPIQQDKKPACPWKTYQDRPPDESELTKLFANGNLCGLAVVLGPVSGGLAVRDFDEREAYESWAQAYPQLAKTLPTVRTSRGYHVYFTAPDVVGICDLGDGELRGKGSYVLLPPSRHPSGCVYEWIVPLASGPPPEVDPCSVGLARMTHRGHRERSEHKRAERTEEIGPDGPDLNTRIERTIQNTLPNGPGQRHRKLFDLARELKSFPELADLKPRELMPVVRRWFDLALPFITTKDFDESRIDFTNAWERVKYPKGQGPMDKITQKASASDMPQAAMQYDNPKLRDLVRLCSELQRVEGDEPFRLDCRTAARCVGLGEDFRTASRWLTQLCNDEVIQVVLKGRRLRATKYFYRGD